MISAVEPKRCVASASILGIIIGEFRHKKKLCPDILFEIDKRLKISFHYTILPFGLIVYLWVEGVGKFLFDAEKIA